MRLFTKHDDLPVRNLSVCQRGNLANQYFTFFYSYHCARLQLFTASLLLSFFLFTRGEFRCKCCTTAGLGYPQSRYYTWSWRHTQNRYYTWSWRHTQWDLTHPRRPMGHIESAGTQHSTLVATGPMLGASKAEMGDGPLHGSDRNSQRMKNSDRRLVLQCILDILEHVQGIECHDQLTVRYENRLQESLKRTLNMNWHQSQCRNCYCIQIWRCKVTVGGSKWAAQKILQHMWIIKCSHGNALTENHTDKNRYTEVNSWSVWDIPAHLASDKVLTFRYPTWEPGYDCARLQLFTASLLLSFCLFTRGEFRCRCCTPKHRPGPGFESKSLRNTYGSTLILNEGSRPLHRPRDGPSATFEWLFTLWYQQTARTSNSHWSMASKSTPSSVKLPTPDTKRAKEDSLSKKMTTLSQGFTAITGSSWVTPIAVASVLSSKTMPFFSFGLRSPMPSAPSLSERNDSTLPVSSKRTPPSPPVPPSKQASVYRW